jgi:hypothetical protein
VIKEEEENSMNNSEAASKHMRNKNFNYANEEQRTGEGMLDYN